MDPSHKDRAAKYRKIAEETRAQADRMSSALAQQEMRAAAAVWDKLAELSERMAKLND